MRLPWSIDHFLHERAIALGQAIDSATWKNYGSALNSYLEFIRIHNFDVDPTEDKLSYFVVFMSYHIKPSSVNTYLSGICQQLEPFFQVSVLHKNQNWLRELCAVVKECVANLSQENYLCLLTTYVSSIHPFTFPLIMTTNFFWLNFSQAFLLCSA